MEAAEKRGTASGYAGISTNHNRMQQPNTPSSPSSAAPSLSNGNLKQMRTVSHAHASPSRKPTTRYAKLDVSGGADYDYDDESKQHISELMDEL